MKIFTSYLIIFLFCITNYSQSQTTRSEAPTGISDPYYPFHPNVNVPFSSSNLPIVIITMKARMADKSADTRVEADMKIIYRTDGSRNSMADTVSTNFTNSSIINYSGRIGIKYRGNSSYGMSYKKPFSIRTEDSEGAKKEANILGMNPDSDWALLASWNDRSLIRNILPYNLAKGYSEYVPSVKCCELILDGVYQGVYLMTERIKRGTNRMDLPKPKTSGDALTGGYHLEIDDLTDPGFYSDYYCLDLYGNICKYSMKHYYQFKYPDIDDYNGGMTVQKNYIINHVKEFENIMASGDYKNPETGYRKYIDVQSFVDFTLAQEFTRNIDGYRRSTPLYKYADSKDPRFKMAIWDFDLALGNIALFDGWSPEGWAWNFNKFGNLSSGNGHRQIPFWIKKLLADEDVQKELRDRWTYYRKTNFTNENIMSKIDSLATLLSEAQTRNTIPWGIWGQDIGYLGAYYVSRSYEEEITALKNWITKRLAWMDSQLLTQYPNNLIANGSFDCDGTRNIAKSSILSNWQTSGSVTISTASPYNGDYALALTNNGQVYQTLTELPKGRYTLKAWIRTQGTTNSTIFIRDFGQLNFSQNIDTSSTYKEVIIPDISVTKGVCDVGFSVTGSTLYIDNISFYRQKDTTYTTSIADTICQGNIYHFGGNNLAISGIYYDTLISNLGFDSIIKLNLTVNPTYLISQTANICAGDTYFWKNRNLASSGIYSDTLQSQWGCDSIIQLTLTVNSSHLISQEVSICSGDIYSFGNKDLTTSGIYYDTLQNINGCDSIIKLTLTVLPKVNINLGNDTTIKANEHLILDAGSSYKTYLWSTGDTTQTIILDSTLGIGAHSIWVVVTTEHGCIGSDTIQVIFKNESSIEQLETNKSVSLYPNPTTGEINLEFSSPKSRGIAVWDINGRIMYHQRHIQQKFQLDLSFLPSGTYTITIDNTIQKKFILK